jgi:hypothetical protein
VASKLAISAALLAALALNAAPAGAKLDTATFKAGEGATVEYSQIGDESAASVVAKLKQMIPEIQARLGADAEHSGSGYPNSLVKEFDTVKSEIAALERQLVSDTARGTAANSGVKSTASGIEQQVNALKAILGFD